MSATRYDSETHPALARDLCRNGRTNKQVADELGIGTRTFDRWRNKYPEFKMATESGKAVADDQVEASLFKRALGYDYEEIETIEGERSRRKITKRKHMPGDVTAQIFWLKHRRRQQWGDRQSDLDENEQTKIDELLKRMEGEADAILQPQAGEEVHNAAEPLES